MGPLRTRVASIARRAYTGWVIDTKHNAMAVQPRTRRIVPAPAPSHPNLRPTVLNVHCADDEDVEWLWTESAEGRFVSGYTLVPRKKSGQLSPG
jgi:hypothetical protein